VELGSTDFSLQVFFFLPKCSFVVFKSLKAKVNFALLLCVIIPNFCLFAWLTPIETCEAIASPF
jgi:hypothetical protein